MTFFINKDSTTSMDQYTSSKSKDSVTSMDQYNSLFYFVETNTFGWESRGRTSRHSSKVMPGTEETYRGLLLMLGFSVSSDIRSGQ